MKQLGVFAKYWAPGKVKTRLADSIGDERACQIYECFVRHLLNKLANVDARRVLAIAPPESQSVFRKTFEPTWQVEIQATGNLGQRMARYFADSLAKPASQDTNSEETDSDPDNKPPRKTLLIGTDSPQIAVSDIERAFEALDRADVVLGPTYDGGYYLIGMKRSTPELFEGIEWSSSVVFARTLEVVQSLNLSLECLPQMHDIDYVEDIRAVAEIVNASGSANDIALFEKTLKWI